MKLRQLRNILPLIVFFILPFFVEAAEITLPALDFPSPTGLYRVGTTYLSFVDKNRPETFTPDKTDFRELEVQVWYPVKPGSQSTLASYWRNSGLIGSAIVKDMFAAFPPALGTFTDSSLTAIGSGQTHAYLDALVADEGKSFPVIIFSHGYGGLISQNTVQMEELASFGYIVFSISHNYEAAIALLPGGRAARYADIKDSLTRSAEERKNLQPLFGKFMAAQSTEEKMTVYKEICQKSIVSNENLSRWAADIRFFADQLATLNADNPLFKGKLDLDKLGLLGHSFGGTSSMQALLEDKRFKACIDLDGQQLGTWQFENSLNAPYMEMWSEPTYAIVLPIVYDMGKSAAYRLLIKGSKHYNYSDMSLFPTLFKTIGFLGEIDGKRCIKIYNDYTRAFFDKHLKNLTTPLLDGPSGQYPEVIFQSRNTEKKN